MTDRDADRLVRADAMRDGAKRYTGRDCPKGHGPERYTASAQCVVCTAERSLESYQRGAAKRHAEKALTKVRRASPNGLKAARAARAQARIGNARTYQGQDCHAAHGGTRYTSNGTCVQCAVAQRIAQGERIKADRKAKGLPTRNRSALGYDILADL